MLAALAGTAVNYQSANVPHRQQCIGSMLVNEYLYTAMSTQGPKLASSMTRSGQDMHQRSHGSSGSCMGPCALLPHTAQYVTKRQLPALMCGTGSWRCGTESTFGTRGRNTLLNCNRHTPLACLTAPAGRLWTAIVLYTVRRCFAQFPTPTAPCPAAAGAASLQPQQHARHALPPPLLQYAPWLANRRRNRRHRAQLPCTRSVRATPSLYYAPSRSPFH